MRYSNANFLKLMYANNIFLVYKLLKKKMKIFSLKTDFIFILIYEKENITTKKNHFNAYMNSFKFILKQFFISHNIKSFSMYLCMDFLFCVKVKSWFIYIKSGFYIKILYIVDKKIFFFFLITSLLIYLEFLIFHF